MAELWERQGGESRQAFQAFALYRDMAPTRSCDRVGKELGKSNTLMERWCTRDRWVARAEAWDDEQDRIKRITQTKQVQEMAERHAKLAVTVLNKVISRLIGDDAKKVPPIDPATLNARDLATLLDIGVKVERLSRGEPSDSLEVGGRQGRPIAIREVLVKIPEEPDAE